MISLHCELFPTHTLQWPGHNSVQIMCNRSDAHHMVWRDCSVIISLTEFKLRLFLLYFIGWTINQWRRGENRSSGENRRWLALDLVLTKLKFLEWTWSHSWLKTVWSPFIPICVALFFCCESRFSAHRHVFGLIILPFSVCGLFLFCFVLSRRA